MQDRAWPTCDNPRAPKGHQRPATHQCSRPKIPNKLCAAFWHALLCLAVQGPLSVQSQTFLVRWTSRLSGPSGQRRQKLSKVKPFWSEASRSHRHIGGQNYRLSVGHSTSRDFTVGGKPEDLRLSAKERCAVEARGAAPGFHVERRLSGARPIEHT